MKKLFGTDGIRGLTNQAPMDAATLQQIAMAAGMQFTRGDHRHLAIVGKDTRLSGYMIENAIVSGLVSIGMDVRMVGPMPTPAIALLTRSLRADIGIVISASHNPYYDNGLKFFGPDGYKLSDVIEGEIETTYRSGKFTLCPPDSIGQVKRINDGQGRYIEYAKNTVLKKLNLSGVKIVVDCAHGASYNIAPQVLWELGAEVIQVGCDPDGFNINADCGATYPALIQAEVLNHKADWGIAFDGDADRVIMCDEKGKMLDGDQILALIAESWSQMGQLKGDGIVATVMSSMGLADFLKGHKLNLYRTVVGDRYVGECMRKNNLNVGGEQSGHIILSDYATTGDGLLAALQVLAIAVTKDKRASELQMFSPMPQILKNIVVQHKGSYKDPAFILEVKRFEAELGDKGRILVRRSGTENLVRIMVEGHKMSQIQNIAEHLAACLLAYDKACND